MSRRVNPTTSDLKPRISGDSFAERLRSAMEHTTSVSSIEEFARSINKPLRTVQRWRSGANEPTAADLITLADALHVDPRDLFPPNQEAA